MWRESANVTEDDKEPEARLRHGRGAQLDAAAKSRPFSLLCGYHMSLFDRPVQTGVLPEICQHTGELVAAPTL